MNGSLRVQMTARKSTFRVGNDNKKSFYKNVISTWTMLLSVLLLFNFYHVMLICSIIIVIISSIINISGGCKLSIVKYVVLVVFFFAW